MKKDSENETIAVIGLGYVGLPLAVEFGKHRPVIGFDITSKRIAELRVGHDGTREVTSNELAAAERLTVTDDPTALRDRIDAQFGVSTRIVGAMVQVAPSDPPSFLSALYEALGDYIRSATIRTPTLEDVFMVHAGVLPGDSREKVLTRNADPEGPS